MALAELGNRLAENSVTSNFVYDIVLFCWQIIVSIFFREIRPRGAYNIPCDGPVIFAAAPHHNQFLDLLIAVHIYRETGRRVQFLVAAKSMARGAVGFFARLLRSIPIVRATDEAKPGTGRITLSNDDPCVVIGIGTKFLSEFEPRMQIMLPKTVGFMVAEVLEVKSDTELRIKREFGGDSGKGTALIRSKMSTLGVEGLDFKKMPHVDQQETYYHVYKCLRDGGCIVIFPEGGSHDRTDLLPLKAGVSLMALGAMVNNPGLKVKIVPVGLSYFHPHKFRSRAVVEFGTAMDVPSDLVDLFQQGGPKKREAVGNLLDLIYDGIKTVTIRAPDYDTLMFIQAARRLYVTPGQHLTLSQVVQLNKRFLESYQRFKYEPRVQKLRNDVLRYNRMLRNLGIRDHQVPVARRANWQTLSLFLYRILLLSLWTSLALPGGILNTPIFITAKVVSRKKAKQALAESVVKVAARDVIGSWKVLISLGLAPILYAFYALLAELVMMKANAPFAWKLWTPIMVTVALPIIGYAALKFGEAGVDVLKSLRPLLIALVPGQLEHLEELKAMRRRLASEVRNIVNEYGPKVYNDFEENRILVPWMSLPPPSCKTGLPHRGMDGQGKLLAHPMMWLDDHLFGWSRSASHTSGLWADDKNRSGSSSSTTTPDISDDDIGDYDDLLGYLDMGKNAPCRKKCRLSAHSSYADLQKLRRSSSTSTMRGATSSDPMTPSAGAANLMPNPTIIENGLRARAVNTINTEC